MNAEQAQTEFLQKVYAPRFVEKLASAGIEIKTEEDLGAALETTAMLKLAREHEAKANPGTPVKEARDILKQAMFGEAERTNAVASDKGLLEATTALLATSN